MKWSCHKAIPSEQKRTSFLKGLVSQRYKHVMGLKNNSKQKIKNSITIRPHPANILLLNPACIMACRNSSWCLTDRLLINIWVAAMLEFCVAISISILKVARESMKWVSKS